MCNDELRQDGTAADMITRPAAALALLARLQPLDPGDLLLTGTPGGTALQAPPAVIEKMIDRRRGRGPGPRDPARRHTGQLMTATLRKRLVDHE
jgi:2-keto-4-pentenoate hydratase/2-oxohepta-3-ene-1,7-dioic acid hydratase in catechol pathway